MVLDEIGKARKEEAERKRQLVNDLRWKFQHAQRKLLIQRPHGRYTAWGFQQNNRAIYNVTQIRYPNGRCVTRKATETSIPIPAEIQKKIDSVVSRNGMVTMFNVDTPDGRTFVRLTWNIHQGTYCTIEDRRESVCAEIPITTFLALGLKSGKCYDFVSERPPLAYELPGPTLAANPVFTRSEKDLISNAAASLDIEPDTLIHDVSVRYSEEILRRENETVEPESETPDDVR